MNVDHLLPLIDLLISFLKSTVWTRLKVKKKNQSAIVGDEWENLLKWEQLRILGSNKLIY